MVSSPWRAAKATLALNAGLCFFLLCFIFLLLYFHYFRSGALSYPPVRFVGSTSHKSVVCTMAASRDDLSSLPDQQMLYCYKISAHLLLTCTGLRINRLYFRRCVSLVRACPDTLSKTLHFLRPAHQCASCFDCRATIALASSRTLYTEV